MDAFSHIPLKAHNFAVNSEPFHHNGDQETPSSLPETTAPELTEEEKKEHELISRLQRRIRNRLANNFTESGEFVPTLKDSTGNVVAYRIWPEKIQNGRSLYPWSAFPPEINSNEKKGGNKTLTHANNKYVGLTRHEKSEDTFSAEILRELIDAKCTHFIPQIPINDTQLIALNLGQNDLLDRINQGVKFELWQFYDLACELDRLHAKDIIYRDFKPDNMFEGEDKQIVVTDLGMMGKVGSFPCPAGTLLYWPDIYQQRGYVNSCDNAAKTDDVNGFKRDQYSFLLAAIQAITNAPVPTIKKVPQGYIYRLTQRMTCNETLKQNLKEFMLNPRDNALTNPLADYIPRPINNNS